MKRTAWTLMLVLVLGVGAACAGSDSGDADSGGAEGGDAMRAVPAVGEAAGDEAGAGGASRVNEESASLEALQVGGKTQTRLPTVGPSVIKTADLRMAIPEGDLEEVVQDATSIAAAKGGFILSSRVSDERFGSGSVVLRVPYDRFEDTLADLKELGDVRQEQVAGEDVSEEFIDLEARLRNWRSQETVMLQLMQRATTIDQTIRVQNELSRVQLEIEQIRGRLDYLQDQTAFSTIAVSVFERNPDENGTGAGDPNPFERAWEGAKDVTIAVTTALIVGLGYTLPLAILAVIVYLLYRLVRPLMAHWTTPKPQGE